MKRSALMKKAHPESISNSSADYAALLIRFQKLPERFGSFLRLKIGIYS